MYFLINESDNSVNCASEQPFPEFMCHAGLFKVEADVSHLPEGTILVDCFWNPDNQTIILNTEGFQRITEQEFAAYINQQQLINQAISSADVDKYNKLVNFLASVFPDNEQIRSILADETVTQEELQQIEDMLGNK